MSFSRAALCMTCSAFSELAWIISFSEMAYPLAHYPDNENVTECSSDKSITFKHRCWYWHAPDCRIPASGGPHKQPATKMAGTCHRFRDLCECGRRHISCGATHSCMPLPVCLKLAFICLHFSTNSSGRASAVIAPMLCIHSAQDVCLHKASTVVLPFIPACVLETCYHV